MRLDHVLVSPDIGVRSVKEGHGQGSDHRPIVAELVLGTEDIQIDWITIDNPA